MFVLRYYDCMNYVFGSSCFPWFVILDLFQILCLVLCCDIYRDTLISIMYPACMITVHDRKSRALQPLGILSQPKEDSVFDLKPLSDTLKYAYLDEKKIYLVIINSNLSGFEEERLLETLHKHRGAIGYTLDDLKGISPSIFQHTVNLEPDAKPVVDHQ